MRRARARRVTATRSCAPSPTAATGARSWRRSSIPTRSPRAWRPGWAARLRTTIGGRLDPARFEPMPFEGDVVRLSDGRFTSEADGLEWWSGATAVLKNETMTIVATSRPVMLYDRSLFLAHGQDPRDFDAVVVKSPHCEPRFFRDWAARIDRRRCARLHQREPAQPGSRPLPATDLPARRRRSVRAPRRAVLAAQVRRPAERGERPSGGGPPVRIREIRGGRPVRRDARGRLEQRAPTRGFASTRSSRS